MAKDKPYYPHNPIASIDALAKTLGVIPGLLKDLAKDASSSYVKFQIETKNNKKRDVFEPKYELKKIQKRINSRIFEKVIYPPYLQGGIKDQENPRDYIENSKLHAGSKFLISVDIKNFYPSIREDFVLDIFKNFFHFPDEVSIILTKLLTLDGRLPQGACTSSYVANLIFYNSEYSLVSKFRSQGLIYSRLLDDITVSSPSLIPQNKSTDIVVKLSALAKKHQLSLNPKKTKLERSDDLKADYLVTGVWVGHGEPKLRRSDRRYIRQLVFICEKEYTKNCYSDEYHKLWNRVSGQVSKLSRLGHPEAKDYRKRMSLILPLYNDIMKSKIIFEANKLLKKPKASHGRVGVIDAYRRVIHSLGILSRTDRGMSRALRRQLTNKFSDIPSKSRMWE